jgi:hypothetical protein
LKWGTELKISCLEISGLKTRISDISGLVAAFPLLSPVLPD